MNNESTYKKFINYFTKWEGAAGTGTGLLLVSFLCMWLGWAYSFLLFILSFPCLIGGIGFFFYGNIGRVSGEEIQNVIDRTAQTITFPELEEDSHLRKRTPKTYEDQLFQGYSMHQGVYVKKLKNASLCSSEYDVAKMVELNDAFYVKALRFSLISDEKELRIYDVPFASIEQIEVVRDRVSITSGKNRFLAKTCHIVFTYDGGKQMILPANDDIYTDEYVENLKRRFGI